MTRTRGIGVGALLACLLLLELGAEGVNPVPAMAQSSMRSGESRVTVPNVRGKRRADAERLLDEAGFSTVQIYEVETDKKGLAGVVKDQQPFPGKVLPVSAIIKLSVYHYNP